MLAKFPYIFIALSLALIAVLSVLFSTLPHIYKVVIIITLYICLIIFVLFYDKGISLLGLKQEELINGLKTALPFMIAIITIAGLAFLIRPELFQDARYQYTTNQLLVALFITLPFATVLIEELIFRGFLYGLIASNYPALTAGIISSLTFGVWHVYSARAITLPLVQLPQFISIILIVAATTIAGLLLNLVTY